MSLSYFVTVGQSVSHSVLTLSPSGIHDQILAVVKTVTVLFVVGSLKHCKIRFRPQRKRIEYL